jgi:DNA invertase Pin-like site-specific DNA recombinase
MSTLSTAKSFGYIRVSTAAQTLDRQTDALTAKGIAAADIFSDKISGTKQSRPGLDELLRHVRPGDSITVHSLDRLGRSALHVMSTIADLSERGIFVRSLKEGEDLTGATGKLMAGFMILVAEWERSMNAERVAEARASRAARAKAGEQIAGRPRTALAPAKVEAVHRLHVSGMTPTAIAANQGISRASVYRALELSK